MGKWLRIACFLTSVFLIINVFPHFSRKKNRATSPPESRTHPFSTQRLKLKRNDAASSDAGTRSGIRLICQNLTSSIWAFALLLQSLINSLQWLLLFSNSLRTTPNQAVGRCKMACLEPASLARIIMSGLICGKYMKRLIFQLSPIVIARHIYEADRFLKTQLHSK